MKQVLVVGRHIRQTVDTENDFCLKANRLKIYQIENNHPF